MSEWGHNHDLLKVNNSFLLQEIVQLLEADLYDKVRSYYKKYIEVELERAKSGQELFDSLNTKTIRSSRGTNYQLFCVAYPSLTENIS